MKAGELGMLTVLFFYAGACAGHAPAETVKHGDIGTGRTPESKDAVKTDTFETGKVITHVFCKTDPVQSYALYIPAKGNKKEIPVVYFFDPHGDGSLPLVKYKVLADSYDFILIGSNNSKNGNSWETAANIWDIMFADSQKRLKIDRSRMYTCGFSGGAKVAAYAGLNHNEVKGVIANGAALPEPATAGNFNFSFTAIAGRGDMNMTDLVAFNSELDKTTTRHRLIFFDGKHEWAPDSTMNIAFAGLQFDAMYQKVIAADNAFISSYLAESKKRIELYSNTGSYIKADAECRLSISMLGGVFNTDWFKHEDAVLQNDPLFKRQLQIEKRLFVEEQKLKAEYMQLFQQEDVNYWHKTISNLQAKANPGTAEGAMYQRLLAYLSLAFYSISNQLIGSNQDAGARYFVELYKMADATNSEAWYFSAILNARNNSAVATENDLRKAVEYGFTDEDRMMQQPEFRNLQAQINFSPIADKIRKKQ